MKNVENLPKTTQTEFCVFSLLYENHANLASQ